MAVVSPEAKRAWLVVSSVVDVAIPVLVRRRVESEVVDLEGSGCVRPANRRIGVTRELSRTVESVPNSHIVI